MKPTTITRTQSKQNIAWAWICCFFSFLFFRSFFGFYFEGKESIFFSSFNGEQNDRMCVNWEKEWCVSAKSGANRALKCINLPPKLNTHNKCEIYTERTVYKQQTGSLTRRDVCCFFSFFLSSVSFSLLKFYMRLLKFSFIWSSSSSSSVFFSLIVCEFFFLAFLGTNFSMDDVFIFFGYIHRYFWYDDDVLMYAKENILSVAVFFLLLLSWTTFYLSVCLSLSHNCQKYKTKKNKNSHRKKTTIYEKRQTESLFFIFINHVYRRRKKIFLL